MEKTPKERFFELPIVEHEMLCTTEPRPLSGRGLQGDDFLFLADDEGNLWKRVEDGRLKVS